MRLFRFIMAASSSPKKYQMKRIPERVLGMTKWNPELFASTLKVPAIETPVDKVSALKPVLAKYVLKLKQCQSVRELSDSHKRILLDPDHIQTLEDFESEDRQKISSIVENFELTFVDLDLTIDNWKTNELLKAVLPNDDSTVSGYSIIGHIVHLNLKEEMLPYKNVVGEILLTLRHIRTVVNKTSTIDNTYRNFQLEVLAGEEDFEVIAKENGCSFKLDFSKVYWNPRLSTEHLRIVQGLGENDILCDVFAGVGPFSVPAAKDKKRCLSGVYANDLNPTSFAYLTKNIELNVKNRDRVKLFNLDGREFIKTVVKDVIVKKRSCDSLQIAMNLPALAVEFLDAFVGLFDEGDFSQLKAVVHVYTFTKAEDAEADIKGRCREALNGHQIPDFRLNFVRNVAPKKDMYRATFTLTSDILLDSNKNEENFPPPAEKKQKVEDEKS